MFTGHVTRPFKSFLKSLRALPLLVPLVVMLLPGPATAQSSGQGKIQPTLLADMTANPLAQIPVIIEMAPASAPFSSDSNLTLAQQAVSILNLNGHAFGALPIVQGAAGVSTAAGITAMSQLPQVASIEEDSVVRARRPSGGGPAYPQAQLSSLYVQEVNTPKVWQQGGNGKGVAVAVLDSGVANDVDLTQKSPRILAHVGFAGPENPQQPDPGGHGTHIAGIIAGDGTGSAGQYIGVAPQANIVDVQVLDSRGNGRMSSVLRGEEWVLA